MIVLDASVCVEWSLNTPLGQAVSEQLRRATTLHAPHLVDVEVTQALRRYTHAGEITAERGLEALEAFGGLDIERYEHAFLRRRMWELRDNVTAYDACYVALAECLRAPLLTTDARLSRAPGLRAPVELIAISPDP